ncbi:MAG: type II secretion system protein [Opitutales bacterium]
MNNITHTHAKKKGFTLVEIMIVVVIIGLLAAMAIPAFQKVRDSSQASRIANDMKKVTEAFDVLLLERPMPDGIYTSTSAPGGFPVADLPEEIQAKPFGSDSQISYDINAGLTGAGNLGVVLNRTTPLDDNVLAAVDRILDNGDISSGQGTKRNANQYVLIVGNH